MYFIFFYTKEFLKFMKIKLKFNTKYLSYLFINLFLYYRFICKWYIYYKKKIFYKKKNWEIEIFLLYIC